METTSTMIQLDDVMVIEVFLGKLEKLYLKIMRQYDLRKLFFQMNGNYHYSKDWDDRTLSYLLPVEVEFGINRGLELNPYFT